MIGLYYAKGKNNELINSLIINSVIVELENTDPKKIVECGMIVNLKKEILIMGERLTSKFVYNSCNYEFLLENKYNIKAAYLCKYIDDICFLIKPQPLYEDFITDYLIKLFR